MKKKSHDQGYGVGHRWTAKEARKQAARGGRVTAKDRAHMAEIGRKGGRARRGFKKS